MTDIYSYNGIKLPALPEWDKEIYPYVHIYPYDNGYSMIAKDRKSVYGEITVDGMLQYKVYSEYSAGEEITLQASMYLNGAWGSVITYSYENTVTGDGVYRIRSNNNDISWSNYDIINEDDNGVYLYKSEPVLVIIPSVEVMHFTAGYLMGERIIGQGKQSPTLAASYTWYKGATSKETLTTINIVDTYKPNGYEIESWIADEDETGSIMCYIHGTHLIIAGNGSGKIYANEDSSYLFGYYKNTDTGKFNSITTITGLRLFDTSRAKKMHYMFNYCEALQSLDLSSFNTSNVTDMSYMFWDCASLTELDLSSFDTSNVTDMSHMFCHCASLTNLDLSSFDTSNVTDMNSIFWDCANLTVLNLSSFDTSNVTDMNHMFSICKNLTTLDLSSFDTSNVTDMNHMFAETSNLKKIYVSVNWKTAENTWNMFKNAGTSTLTYI